MPKANGTNNILWELTCSLSVCLEEEEEDSSSVSVQLCFGHLQLQVRLVVFQCLVPSTGHVCVLRSAPSLR